MMQYSIPDLVNHLIALSGGNAQQAAQRLGTSTTNLSRWRSGNSRPRRQYEERLRTLVNELGDPANVAAPQANARLERLEEAVSGTVHALREEFHRTASVSTRQEVLDLVAVLFFAHVTSIDSGMRGIGEHLRTNGRSAIETLNHFMVDALTTNLPILNKEGKASGLLGLERFFAPFSKSDEQFVAQLLRIFEREANAFRELHEAGRDDLINEVFSRFMSTSFVDEKEMGQYLTPPEITRFMVEVGFHALTPAARSRLLTLGAKQNTGIILDPSCGVGSFLAETIRYCHAIMREQYNNQSLSHWLSQFIEQQVVGIDKSERMLRLAMINLGLFGAKAANLRLANALARSGEGGQFCRGLEGRIELILTNPPFGASYSGDDLQGFIMGQQRARAESEVLFLERYVDWLAPGGVVVSVVPDSILVNRNAFAELRVWLHDRCSVEAVFSLPTVTFGAAGTNTKTSIIVLRKHDQPLVQGMTYFGEAREVGFDVVTRSSQRRRIRIPQNDLPTLLAEYKGETHLKLGRRGLLGQTDDRWDACFHIGLPEKIAALIEHPQTEFIKVADVASLVDERVDPRRQGWSEFNYVEISDVDARMGLVGSKRIASTEAPSRARKLIQAGDVLVSTVRPERGAVGATPARLDGAVCSTGFAVLRCSGIHPLALVWLLKTELVRHQMIRNNIGIAYPAVTEQSCLNLVLPVTRQGIATLTAAAAKLAAAQEQFETIQLNFLTTVHNFDCASTEADPAQIVQLGKVPHLIEGCKPSSVSNPT